MVDECDESSINLPFVFSSRKPDWVVAKVNICTTGGDKHAARTQTEGIMDTQSPVNGVNKPQPTGFLAKPRENIWEIKRLF